MSALWLLAYGLSSLVIGVLFGATWARWRLVELLRRLNGERDLRDQAVGADLLRQMDRMRGHR